jgi:hypothetical protein
MGMPFKDQSCQGLFHQPTPCLGMCTQPTDIRYRHLFTSRMDTMVQFLRQDDLVSLARFIADCFDHFQSGSGPS